MNQIIQDIIQKMVNIIPNLIPSAVSICLSLMVIDLILAVLSDIEGDAFSILWKRCLKYGFYLYMIKNWGVMSDRIKDGFVWVGNKALGSASSTLVINPSYILSKGLDEIGPALVDGASISGIMSLMTGNPLILLVTGLLIISVLVGLAFMALEIGLVLIEFNIVAGFCVILLPFGVFKQTSFIAMKAWNAMINVGVKIGIITLVYGISFKILNTMKVTPTDIGSLYEYVATLLLLIFVCRKATSIANTVINGNGGMTASEARGAAGAAAGAVVTNSQAGSRVMNSAAVKSVTSAVTSNPGVAAASKIVNTLGKGL